MKNETGKGLVKIRANKKWGALKIETNHSNLR